ncbi:MAG: hypothetical protein LC789_13440 [Actinobacteria bacterium]|nr:hypothetical protein [Actinomycetota bacterium]MCA1721170.1 hypothetical protein [Actinomycetota bacterium]
MTPPAATARSLAAACAELTGLAETAAALEDAGWTVHKQRVWALAPPPGPALAGGPTLVADAARLTGGQLQLAVDGVRFAVRPVGGRLVSELVNGDPETAFGGAALAAARAAAAGDASAAVGLSGTWTGQLTIDATAGLRASEPARAWHVLDGPDGLVRLVAATPFWHVGRALRRDGLPAVAVCLSGGAAPAVLYDAPGLLVTTSAALAADPGLARRPAPAGPATGQDLVAPDPGLVPGLRGALLARSAGAALAALANAASYDDAAQTAVLTFQGSRQRRLAVPAAGWAHEPGAVLELYRWAQERDQQDRVLAVQQTVAGYTPDELAAPGGIAGVHASADTVQRILRSEAVGTALDVLRDTRKAAVDAARSSSDAALGAARSVAERVLASLAATGGVVVAQAAAKLTPDIARHLVVAVSCYLGFLAVWSLLVEGPAVTAPLRSFEHDLPVTADLLGEVQRTEVLALRSLRLAWWRARTVRVVAPVAYAVAGAVVSGLAVKWLSDLLGLPLLVPA